MDATLTASDVEVPAGWEEGDELTLSATIIVDPVQIAEARHRKRQGGEPTDCILDITIDGQSVYNELLVGTFEPLRIITDAFTSTGSVDILVTQSCGLGDAAIVTIYDFVLAVSSTTTTTRTTTSSTRTRHRPTQTGFPDRVNGFDFLGCFGSRDNFPTFELAFSSPRMDIDVCTDICRGWPLAGVHQEYVPVYSLRPRIDS